MTFMLPHCCGHALLHSAPAVHNRSHQSWIHSNWTTTSGKCIFTHPNCSKIIGDFPHIPTGDYL